MSVIGLADHDDDRITTSNVDDSLRSVTGLMVDMNSTYSVIKELDKILGIITYGDIIALLGERIVVINSQGLLWRQNRILRMIIQTAYSDKMDTETRFRSLIAASHLRCLADFLDSDQKARPVMLLLSHIGINTRNGSVNIGDIYPVPVMTNGLMNPKITIAMGIMAIIALALLSVSGTVVGNEYGFALLNYRGVGHCVWIHGGHFRCIQYSPLLPDKN